MFTATWTSSNSKTTEDLTLNQTHASLTAHSIIRGTDPVFTCQYQITCNAHWNFREAQFHSHDGQKLRLRFDGKNWIEGEGLIRPDLAPAHEINFILTPFTNTLPVKRLGLRQGQSADILTAWVDFPSLEIKPDPQRYTCLEEEKLYRFESLESGFTADIELGEGDLVQNYPGLSRRLP